MSPFFRRTNTKKRHSLHQRGLFRKLTFKQKISIFLVIPTVLLTVVYLFQINDLAIKGFEIRSLENKIKELEQENKNIKLKATELQDLSNIMKDLETELNMVKVEHIEYISSSAPATARR